MKDFVPNINPQHYRSPRSRIKCDLVDCGCKSSSMIWISHPLKAIWFETPKAASASIKKTLDIVSTKPPGNKSPIARLFGGRKEQNKRPEFQFEMWAGDEYGVIKSYPDYFKFAIVRNPWDQMVSNWSMFCRAGLPGREKKIETLFGKKADEIGFDEFIRRSVQIHNHHWQQFIDFLPREGDTLLLDYLGRMESLEKDWNEITRRLGINVKLTVGNQTAHHQYREYYDDELREIVAASHKDDIRVFQYEF